MFQGPCTWCSVSGRRVVLKPINILHLADAERIHLQRLSLPKLEKMDLATPIVVPKGRFQFIDYIATSILR